MMPNVTHPGLNPGLSPSTCVSSTMKNANWSKNPLLMLKTRNVTVHARHGNLSANSDATMHLCIRPGDG